MDLLTWLPLEQIAAALPVSGDLGLALGVFLLTLTLTACSVPGVLIPLSLTCSAMSGPFAAIAAVALGAVAGSQLLFTLTRRIGAERIRARLGGRLGPLERGFERYGAFAIVGLRAAGAPGPLVTAGAALMPIRGGTFAVATLAGLLPSVTLAAATGAGAGLLF